MAALDRLRRRRRRANSPRPLSPPPDAARPPRGEPAGRSGTVNTRGFLADDEVDDALRWPASVATYEEMRRSDPSVRAMLALAQTPIRGNPPTVEPAGGEDPQLEQAAFVERCLFGELEGGFEEWLREALDYLTFGYAVFEKATALRTVRFAYAPPDSAPVGVEREAHVLAGLEPRLQHTIQRWIVEERAPRRLAAVEQWLGDGRTPSTVEIPADRLVVLTNERQGDDFRGVSLLRSAYVPWLYKRRLENLEAIALEGAAGLPVVYPPEDADEEVLDEVERVVQRLRMGEAIYAIMPGPKQGPGPGGADGWLLENVYVRGTELDFSAAITRYEAALTRNVLAEFMRLGHETVGARATGDVQQDPYYAAVEAVAGYLEGAINEQVVKPLVDWNYRVDGGYPRLSFSKIQAKNVEVIGQYLAALVTAGLISPDPDLEAWLRGLADAPAPAAEEGPAEPARGEEDGAGEEAMTERLAGEIGEVLGAARRR